VYKVKNELGPNKTKNKNKKEKEALLPSAVAAVVVMERELVGEGW
jgi:hypothetical protein